MGSLRFSCGFVRQSGRSENLRDLYNYKLESTMKTMNQFTESSPGMSFARIQQTRINEDPALQKGMDFEKSSPNTVSQNLPGKQHPPSALGKRYPIHKALKKYYGYDSFRPGQEKLIKALLSGRDILAIMPTGAGKSVCYQIPGIFLDGITIVISPLISLMKDQVAALKAAGIPAAYLNSSLTPAQYRKALAYACQGKYKIIYAAPERLLTPSFQRFAGTVSISMIAVDEAHCVSQWGQNFRPSYLDIAKFADSLPNRPIMAALTATATGPVRQDILNLLKLRHPVELTTGFDRPNLYFAVKKSTDKFRDLLTFLRLHPSMCGIIYCLTRKETEDVADRLCANGFPCGKYHGGMEDAMRNRMQEDFIYDRIPLIAATNAFGMGIDKSNVRFVVHYSMPSSLENYYQEAGRAGRDGEPADCLLLYAPKDLQMNRFLIDQSNQESDTPEQKIRELARLNRMEAYVKTPFCLRSFLLEYFGESSKEDCGNCSNCKSEWEQTDITKEASLIFEALSSLPRKYGISLCCDFLKGSQNAKIRNARLNECTGYGALQQESSQNIRNLLEALLIQGYLVRSQDSYQVLCITELFHQAIQTNAPIVVRQKKESSGRTSSLLLSGQMADGAWQNKQPFGKGTGLPAGSEILSDRADGLFEALRLLRKTLAGKEGIPPYLVFNDRTLREMSQQQPEDEDGLLRISGIGPHKAKKYGQDFLDEILRWKES